MNDSSLWLSSLDARVNVPLDVLESRFDIRTDVTWNLLSFFTLVVHTDVLCGGKKQKCRRVNRFGDAP